MYGCVLTYIIKAFDRKNGHTQTHTHTHTHTQTHTHDEEGCYLDTHGISTDTNKL